MGGLFSFYPLPLNLSFSLVGVTYTIRFVTCIQRSSVRLLLGVSSGYRVILSSSFLCWEYNEMVILGRDLNWGLL